MNYYMLVDIGSMINNLEIKNGFMKIQRYMIMYRFVVIPVSVAI